MLKCRCLVPLKSSADDPESQDGFFQQRGQGLAAQTHLGPDQERSFVNTSMHLSPRPRLCPGFMHFLLFSKQLPEETGSGLGYYGLSAIPRNCSDRWSLLGVLTCFSHLAQ